MSMICSVLGVTSAQIRALRVKPALASKLALVARIDLLRAHIDVLTQRTSPEQRAQFGAADERT
jgi:RNA processing factor Prp31